MTDIVTTLRKAWLTSGLTLAEIGQRMGGWPPQAVSQVLAGKRDMQLATLIRLADALGYDVTVAHREDA